MRGRILLLRLGGSGKCWVEPSELFENFRTQNPKNNTLSPLSKGGLDIIVNEKTQLYERFGHMFFNITDFKVEVEMSGLKMHFQNLFDPVETLGEIILTFFCGNKHRNVFLTYGSEFQMTTPMNI